METEIELHGFTVPHAGQRKLRELVAKPDARVIVAVLGRRWGKTVGTVEMILELALASAIKVGWFAHQYAAVRIAWEEFTKRIPPTALNYARETTHDLELINGSRVEMFTAENPDAALGRGFDLVVLDEGARIRAMVRDEAIPPMLADRDGKLLVLTTPKGKRGPSAWVWRDLRKAQSNQAGYYWLQGPTSDNPLPAIQEHIRFAEANLPRDAYRQEYLAEFLDYGAGVLDLTPICTNGGSEQAPVALPFEEPHDGEPCVMGLDLAQREDFTAAVVLGQQSKRVRAVHRFNRLAWETMVERVGSLAGRYGNCPVMVDATGLGGSVVEMLRNRMQNVTPVTFTNDSKTTLVQGLQVAVEKREFSMPWIAELVSEGAAFEAELLPSGRIRYEAAEGFHDDLVVALMLAVVDLQRTTGMLDYLRSLSEEKAAAAAKAQEKQPGTPFDDQVRERRGWLNA